MDKILLHRIVSILDDEDVKRAKKFLASPFHNTDPMLERYFQLLCKYRPTSDSPHLDSEAVFRALYPKSQPFEEKKLRNLRHKLAHALRSYLAHQSLETDKTARQQLVVETLAARSDHGLFQHEAHSFADLLEKADNRGLDYHWHKARLFHEQYFHPATDHVHAGRPLFWGAVEHLEKFFSLLIFLYKGEAGTRNRFLSEDGHSVFMKEARERLAQRFAPEDRPASFFLDLTEPGSLSVQELFGTLGAYDRLLGHFEFGLAWKILYGHAIRLSNQHDELDHHELVFRLYKVAMEKDFITGRELSDPIRFANIVHASDLAGAFEWAIDFIEKNKKYLDGAVRDSIVHYCLAHLHYHRGRQTQDPTDLGHAMRLISQVEYRNEAFEFRLRTLQLRILYDNLAHDPGVLDTLINCIHNFKKFLARNHKLSEETLRDLHDFASYFHELVKLSATRPLPVGAITSFQVKLEKTKGVALTGWMLERARRLVNEAGR